MTQITKQKVHIVNENSFQIPEAMVLVTIGNYSETNSHNVLLNW